MKQITKTTANRAAVLFGKHADDPQAREIKSNVATWPKSTSDLTDRLGNFARVVKWKARRGPKRRETITEARNHPAVDWLLDLLVPALCARNAKPFWLIADAIEKDKANAFPASQTALATCQLALELAGLAMPFNAVGEPADEEVELPDIIKVPMSESDFRAKVEVRLGWEKGDLNPGEFWRILKRLGIRCRKDPHSGGRGRKVLPRRTAEQKPTG